MEKIQNLKLTYLVRQFQLKAVLEKGLNSTQGKPPIVETKVICHQVLVLLLRLRQAVAALSKGAVTATQVLDSWHAPEIVKNAVTQKALVGTTSEATFGASLVDFQVLSGEFIELLRGKTAVDKLASKCVKSLLMSKFLHKLEHQLLVG